MASPTEPFRQDVWVSIPAPPRPSFWKEYGRHGLLFLLTAASVFFVGGLRSFDTPQGVLVSFDLSGGTKLAVGLLSILLAHEMGHYLACRFHGVDASLPFFLPFPVPLFSLVGTLGAFIRIRRPFPHRRALFDIGIAGPLAGFAVALPVLFLGVSEAQITRVDEAARGLFLGEPLVFQWVTHLLHPPIAEGFTLSLGSLGLAAWFGLFVTALNLIPIGQLDGGHITYALFGERAATISRVAWWICLALAWFGPNWLLWALIVRILGRRHPPTLLDPPPVGRGRALLGLLGLAVFAACFVPNPIEWSWREFFQAMGLTSR